MPNEKSKTVTTMQKIMYTAGALAAVAGGITGYKTIKTEIINFIHVEVDNAKADDVKRFEDAIDTISTKLNNHIEKKKESFAIGLRMHANGQMFYKAEDSREYPAYKDIQMSNTYNYPYYYYINPVNGEKEWCK